MSTAAEHVSLAEALLADANHESGDSAWRPLLLAEAQVHATLALVAVQADALAVAAASSSTLHGVIDVRATVKRARDVVGGAA